MPRGGKGPFVLLVLLNRLLQERAYAQNISLQSPPNTNMTFSLEQNLKSVTADK